MLASNEHRHPIPDREIFGVVGNGVSSAEFLTGNIEPDLCWRWVMVLALWNSLVDMWVHLFPLIEYDIALESRHKVSPLGTWISPVADFGGKEIHDSTESRDCEKSSNPMIIRWAVVVRRNGMSKVGNQEMHAMMGCNQSRRIGEGWRLQDTGLQLRVHGPSDM